MSSRHSGQRIIRAREVVVHRQRLAHRGGRVARRVGAVVDRDVAEVLPGRRRTRRCSATPTRCSRPRPAIVSGPGFASADGPDRPLRRNGSFSADARVPRRAVGGVVHEHHVAQARCAPRWPRRATWLTNGIIGLANHVTSGMPSADWTAGALGDRPADAVDVGRGRARSRAALRRTPRAASDAVAASRCCGRRSRWSPRRRTRPGPSSGCACADHARRSSARGGTPAAARRPVRSSRAPPVRRSDRRRWPRRRPCSVKRRPGCSSSSTVTTGYGVE